MFSNYLSNKMIDWILRGQVFTPPATVYLALATTVFTADGGGVEVAGGSYARVASPCSLAEWAGTQAAASTTLSTGTSDATSNNAAITFPAPTAAWGTVLGLGLWDAPTGGNLLLFGPLTVPKVINSGDPAPAFAPAALNLMFS
jgi:hypothetical protein